MPWPRSLLLSSYSPLDGVSAQPLCHGSCRHFSPGPPASLLTFPTPVSPSITLPPHPGLPHLPGTSSFPWTFLLSGPSSPHRILLPPAPNSLTTRTLPPWTYLPVAPSSANTTLLAEHPLFLALELHPPRRPPPFPPTTRSSSSWILSPTSTSWICFLLSFVCSLSSACLFSYFSVVFSFLSSFPLLSADRKL